MARPLAYNRDHALNALCPYFTMFPLGYPLGILRRHQAEAPIVVDPFCGRGTSIYAARRIGLRAYGFDISPVAVAIAQAKLSTTTLGGVMMLAKKLLRVAPKHVPASEFFRRAYSRATLRELCSLREGLLRVRKETNETAFLRAVALGCLHGPLSKDSRSAGYFSNQMPRTFASKPRYSVKFWKAHGLKPPRVSVLDVIQRKIERIPNLQLPSGGTPWRVKQADARCGMPYRHLSGRLVVVTSPPYYGMKSYIQDQWLRNWFLGGESKLDYEGGVQIRHTSQSDFVQDLGRVWSHLRNRADSIDLYVRFGAVPSRGTDARELFWASIEASGQWRRVSTRSVTLVKNGRRQADQMLAESAPGQEFDFHAVA